jgi:hypothetical protein
MEGSVVCRGRVSVRMLEVANTSYSTFSGAIIFENLLGELTHVFNTEIIG